MMIAAGKPLPPASKYGWMLTDQASIKGDGKVEQQGPGNTGPGA